MLASAHCKSVQVQYYQTNRRCIISLHVVMQRQGLGATGILANLSRAAGFDSVSALLEKNPHAQVTPNPW